MQLSQERPQNNLSELLTKVQCKIGGHVVDVTIFEDSRIALLTSNPSHLYILNPSLSSAMEIDLFDFNSTGYDEQERSPRFLKTIKGKSIEDGLLIFHPALGKLMVFDFARDVISNFKISLDLYSGPISLQEYPSKTKCGTLLTSIVLDLAFLQRSSGRVSILDFSGEQEIVAEFPFQIQSIIFVAEQIWIVQSQDDTLYIAALPFIS